MSSTVSTMNQCQCEIVYANTKFYANMQRCDAANNNKSPDSNLPSDTGDTAV